MDDKPPVNTATTKPVKSKTTPQSSIPAPPFHDLIGAKLKSFYAQIANEPVPDRFTELLKELDMKSQTGKKKS